jgi:hypothetical protein
MVTGTNRAQIICINNITRKQKLYQPLLMNVLLLLLLLFSTSTGLDEICDADDESLLKEWKITTECAIATPASVRTAPEMQTF